MIRKAQKTPGLSQWFRRGILAALLITAGTMIWMQRATVAPLEPVVSPAPASTVRKDERSLREIAYAKDLAALETLLQSGAADPDTQAQAAQRLTRMTAEHQCELALEEALHQAGYLPLLVLCQNGAVTVMVQESLSSEAGAAVLSLCVAHAQVAAENVRIMTMQP